MDYKESMQKINLFGGMLLWVPLVCVMDLTDKGISQARARDKRF